MMAKSWPWPIATSVSKRPGSVSSNCRPNSWTDSNEISHWAEDDYVLINDDLAQCDRSISAILDAERLRRHRRVGLDTFVKQLRKHL